MRHEIATRRLRLVTLGPPVLRALLSGRTGAAAERLAARLPESWGDLEPVFRERLEQLERAPDDEAWLTRAIVLDAERRVVGVTGFHGRPGSAWLREVAPDGVELGYTVFAGDRRRGFATEAAGGLVAWAIREHRVPAFVLSIAPDNVASLGVAEKLGFAHTGEWVHPERGRELVYRRIAAKRAQA